MTVSDILNKRRFGLMAAMVAAVVMSMGGASVGNAAGKGSPFSKLQGKWKCVRGGCWVRPIGKAKERVGCRVRYKVGSGGKSISQSINCRGSIKLTSKAKLHLKKRGRVAGSWTSFNNHTGRTNGGASGTATSSKLFVGISSNKGFRGAMRATISGKKHQVVLYETKNGRRHVVGRLSLRR